jgi:hypothetical protein
MRYETKQQNTNKNRHARCGNGADSPHPRHSVRNNMHVRSTRHLTKRPSAMKYRDKLTKSSIVLTYDTPSVGEGPYE